MPVNTNSIMSNDSLAASLFQGHDYNRSLVGDSLVQQSMEWEKLPDAEPKTNHIGEFFDGVANFLADLPTFVYVIFGVVFAACLAYWMVKSGLFYSNPVLDGDDVEEGTDDIYAVDIDIAVCAGIRTSLVRRNDPSFPPGEVRQVPCLTGDVRRDGGAQPPGAERR